MVLTILTTISQWEGLSHILWKEHVPNHQPENNFTNSCKEMAVRYSAGSVQRCFMEDHRFHLKNRILGHGLTNQKLVCNQTN